MCRTVQIRLAFRSNALLTLLIHHAERMLLVNLPNNPLNRNHIFELAGADQSSPEPASRRTILKETKLGTKNYESDSIKLSFFPASFLPASVLPLLVCSCPEPRFKVPSCLWLSHLSHHDCTARTLHQFQTKSVAAIPFAAIPFEAFIEIGTGLV
jgi:hypothetical protein